MGKSGEKLSAERRRKISESRRNGYLKAVIERRAEDEPTHRRCPRCEETKPVGEFGTRKQKLKCGIITITPRSSCRRCEAKRIAEWKKRKIEEGTWPKHRKRKEESRDKEKHRRYQREWHTARRREKGVKGRNERPEVKEKRLPVEPIAEFLAKMGAPSSLPGVITRRLYAITHLEQDEVTLATVDAILLALDCPEKLHELYPDPNPELIGYHVLDPEGILETVETSP